MVVSPGNQSFVNRGRWLCHLEISLSSTGSVVVSPVNQSFVNRGRWLCRQEIRLSNSFMLTNDSYMATCLVYMLS